MPDFEDSNCPTWDNMVQGQVCGRGVRCRGQVCWEMAPKRRRADRALLPECSVLLNQPPSDRLISGMRLGAL